MSLKPPVITQEQLIEQVQHLTQQTQQIETNLELLQHKLKQIEHSIGENDTLKHKIEGLTLQSIQLFEIEWKRRAEYYPEIRLKVIEKARDLIAPAAPEKK